MKIIRYSSKGFKSQKQTHHIQCFEYWAHCSLDEFPEHLKVVLKEAKEKKVAFYKEHFDDLQEGLWFFIDGYKNRQSLNHLKKPVPCWEAEIDDGIMVYDCNLENIVPLTDSIVQFGGCYIPKRLVSKIHNIRRRKSKKVEEDLDEKRNR